MSDAISDCATDALKKHDDVPCAGGLPRGMTTLAIVVLAVTLFLRMSPAMFQPLRRDEAASVRLYTSFDYV